MSPLTLPLPAEPIDCPISGGGQDPAGRAGRLPLLGPLSNRLDEGFLDDLLGEVEILERSSQGRHRTPDSSRKTRPMLARSIWDRPASGIRVILEWSNLHRSPAGDGRLPCPLQGFVEVGSLDDPDASELLFRFCKRSVGGEHLAIVAGNHCRRARGVQASSENPCSGALQLVVEGVDIPIGRLHLSGGRHFVLVYVDGK